MTLQVAELCAGYGGISMGLTLAGIDHELAWYSEIDKAASTVMATHHTAPNLGDLRDITNPPAVDIVTAGFPCQPVSGAGQGEGIHDERWLIRDVVTVWERSGAPWLILENVPGLLTANNGEAFGQVLEALSKVGATAEWTHLRASVVGAPHKRERWFCIATANPITFRWEGWTRANPGGRSGTPFADSNGPTIGPKQVGVSGGDGQIQPRSDQQTTTDPNDIRPKIEWISGHTSGGSNTDGRLRERFGGYADAVSRWGPIIGREAPEPTSDGRLNPVFVEWMMGLPEGHVTGCDITRPEMLGVLGNGVVPQQAAAALQTLGITNLEEVAA